MTVPCAAAWVQALQTLTFDARSRCGPLLSTGQDIQVISRKPAQHQAAAQERFALPHTQKCRSISLHLTPQGYSSLQGQPDSGCVSAEAVAAMQMQTAGAQQATNTGMCK